jgi:hypothetical protein
LTWVNIYDQFYIFWVLCFPYKKLACFKQTFNFNLIFLSNDVHAIKGRLHCIGKIAETTPNSGSIYQDNRCHNIQQNDTQHRGLIYYSHHSNTFGVPLSWVSHFIKNKLLCLMSLYWVSFCLTIGLFPFVVLSP